MSVDVYPDHEKDLYGWALHTAELLRSQKMNEVDFENIIEEMEALGRTEQDELTSRLIVLLTHLLKWQYQPTMKGHSWKYSIIEQRKKCKIRIKKSPSLKSKMNEILEDAYDVATSIAARETGLEGKVFPQSCPYTFEQIMDDQFYPD